MVVYLVPLNGKEEVPIQAEGVLVVVEPLVYFAFLFVNETVITKTQGLVVAIAKREYINKSK